MSQRFLCLGRKKMVVITDGGINGVVVRRVPLYINYSCMKVRFDFFCYISHNLVAKSWILTTRDWPIDPNALSTLMCFQKYSLSLSSKTHRSIRVHTTDLMRFRLSWQKRKKTIASRVVTWVELSAHATNTRAAILLGIVFILMRFRPPTLIRHV